MKHAGETTPRLVLPSKFSDKDTELTELSRVGAHLSQWLDQDNPNHDNACKALALDRRERGSSPEHAACELAAQHVALATVTAASDTYKPQSARNNSPCREQLGPPGREPRGPDRVQRRDQPDHPVLPGQVGTDPGP